MSTERIVERLRKLGFHTDSVSTEELQSATSALVCLPMYMVANVHGWTGDRQFVVPLLNIHGLEAARESYAIGAEKAALTIDAPHERALEGFLAHARPADILIYEYALDTIRMLLEVATPELAETIRARIGESIVKVANAAGKKLFGTGNKVSDEERACIEEIAEALSLTKSANAAEALARVGVTAIEE